LNKYHNSHPLRERARKLDEGILIIRFEVPFHIACVTCKHMMAKGVRFNAEKKCIGMYLSTRKYEFAFKCRVCKERIVIETDPEHTDYRVREGAKKYLDTTQAKDGVLVDEKEVAKRKANPFA
jgi:coiled-coil domain-containing protein 130